MPPPIQPFNPPTLPFNPMDDNEIMEDPLTQLPPPVFPQQPKKNVPKPPVITQNPPKDIPSKKPQVPPQQPQLKQQSDLQRSLDIDSFVDKVLLTATTVTLRELLGASPAAAKKIQD